MVPMLIDNCPLTMELDTGAAVSVISGTTFCSMFGNTANLQQSNATLRTYLGKELPLLETIEVQVQYESQQATLLLFVIKGQGATLLGQYWLKSIHINWSKINLIDFDNSVEKLLAQHSKLFHLKLGTLQGIEAKIFVPQNAQPYFYKPRPVTYSLKSNIEQELERLEKAGVITPVQFSDWAAPIVPVVKSDGSVRICGDYSVTVSTVSKVDSYSLPKADNLFTAMSGGKLFIKLDLSHAYKQAPLTKVTISTIVSKKHICKFSCH